MPETDNGYNRMRRERNDIETGVASSFLKQEPRSSRQWRALCKAKAITRSRRKPARRAVLTGRKSLFSDPKPHRIKPGQGEAGRQAGGSPQPVLVYPLG